MSPSPALRCSPQRAFRVENHRRGRSLEGGLILKEKDDDLALFNELQTRERDNFLLHSTDDLDDSLSTKLRYFSDFKLGISIPVRGENSDLLNASGRKKDYDWLLTPPDSPLFPSLDDETPPVNLGRRGRPRSQPISISKSATTEKSYKISRSSASPQRLSPSPRSGNSISQSRGRPSSAPHSSSSPLLRPTTPSRRPSTPPNKPSNHAPRSSTPTSRRMSTGSSGTVVSPGRRGISPVKTSQGNSATTKLLAWQSNIPGFSMDAPPNLRTSLSDRPASYVRGSSPASRSGKGSSSKFGRQSMSPTSSRSPCSPYSFDRDQYSSQSKGSVQSSGDDDIDSLQTSSISISSLSVARKVGAFSNSRAPALSKKPSRTPSSSSAPKRCFDSPLRQMDRKSPQNMFRPLLSSVPSTTFYVGKASSAHHPLISTNSSVTTSSNASSEQGGSVAHDTEGSDHGQDDMAIEKDNALYSDAQDEIFILDNVDEINEDVGHEIRDVTGEVEPSESEKFSSQDATTEIVSTISKSLYVEGELSGIDCVRNMAICSQCGRKFDVIEPMGGNDDICPDCVEKAGCICVETPETSVVVTHDITINPQMKDEENELFDELEPKVSELDLQENTSRNAAMLVKHEMNVEQDQPIVGSKQCDSDTVEPKLKIPHPSLKVDVSEGAGISILLNRSSSSKWPVVQGRPFTATNIPSCDPLFARDTMNSMRSSTGYGSASTSSSVDLSSFKQTGAHVQRKLGGRKAESRGSSLSGISNHAYQALLLAEITQEQNFDCSVGNPEYKALEETPLDDRIHDRDSSFVGTDVHGIDELDHTETCRATDASTLDLSSRTRSVRLEDAFVAELPINLDFLMSRNAEDLSNNGSSVSDVEIPVMTPDFSYIKEDNIVEVPTHGSSVIISGELENACEGSLGSQSDCVDFSNSKTIIDEHYPSISTTSGQDASVSAPESSVSNHTHGILEESIATVQGPGQHKRSLTLEEVTDVTLFCRSIVDNLAHQAADIGMEKENSASLKRSSPIVTIFGKSSSDWKDPCGRNFTKPTPKSRKTRQRQAETNVKNPSPKTETDMETHDESLKHVSGFPSKVDNARPPKLESKCNCSVM